MSFESDKPFNDFQHFARGIRRSGEFSIRESEILETCGCAMMDLHNGVRQPQDDVESEFLRQLHGNEVITDNYARIFDKYLHVIRPRRMHRLCSVGADDELAGGDFNTGGDDGGLD